MDYYDPTEQGFWICYNPRYRRGKRIPKGGSLRGRFPKKGIAPKRGPPGQAIGIASPPKGGVRLRTIRTPWASIQVPTPWDPATFWPQDLLLEGGASN